MPSRRRSGPGRTIWPFVETLVCMVRQSYRQSNLASSRPCRGAARRASAHYPKNAMTRWLTTKAAHQAIVSM
jgi:hypothetical protein